jgi:hypothetical protein
MKSSVLKPLEISDLDDLINGHPLQTIELSAPKNNTGFWVTILVLGSALVILTIEYCEKRKELNTLLGKYRLAEFAPDQNKTEIK